MNFGTSSGDGESETDQYKYNAMWMSGMVWQMQAESYISELKAIAAGAMTARVPSLRPDL